jgi:hypothetical protein
MSNGSGKDVCKNEKGNRLYEDSHAAVMHIHLKMGGIGGVDIPLTLPGKGWSGHVLTGTMKAIVYLMIISEKYASTYDSTHTRDMRVHVWCLPKHVQAPFYIQSIFVMCHMHCI